MDSYSKNSLFCENCNDITVHHFDEDWGLISCGVRDPFYYECIICGKRTKSGEITKKQMETLREETLRERENETINKVKKLLEESKKKIKEEEEEKRNWDY